MIKYLIALAITLLMITKFPMAQDKKEAEVIQANEKLRLAMIDGDRNRLEELVADKLSYGHSSGHIDDKNEFLDKISSGKSDFVTISLSDQTVAVSRNTAIVRHILKATTNDGGQPGEVNLRVLLVWQKKKGNWILLARQAVKMN